VAERAHWTQLWFIQHGGARWATCPSAGHPPWVLQAAHARYSNAMQYLDGPRTL